MSQDKLAQPLQESLLALLAFNDKHGSIVAAIVKPEIFGSFYAELAGPILDYRTKYGKAPGHAHIDDVFGDLLFKGDKARRYRETLADITNLARGLNAEFVAGQTQEFVRWQTIKSAIVRAAELIQNKKSNVLQVEEVLYNALKAQAPNVDPGRRLDDEDSLKFLDHNPIDYTTGIRALDNLGFGATRKQMLLYIGPKGTGKSWFCVHMGKQGAFQQAKVLHISNEMSDLAVIKRYYQSLCAATLRNKKYTRVSFKLEGEVGEDFRKFSEIRKEQLSADINFAQPDIRAVLNKKRREWGLRFGNIVVKEFPSGSLTMPMYERYLDRLFAMERFAPTMVCVDYIDLMKHSLDNYRLSIGNAFVGHRGIAMQRNYALVAPTQGGRASIGAKKVRSTHVAEDISKVFTADRTLTYSRTEAEKRSNLARLFVNHNRDEQEGDEIIISQSYATGQFCVSSAFMSNAYRELMKQEEEADE